MDILMQWAYNERNFHRHSHRDRHRPLALVVSRVQVGVHFLYGSAGALTRHASQRGKRWPSWKC